MRSRRARLSYRQALLLPVLSDILRRFRFHGVPGAPTAAVPADRASALDRELLPVFEWLEETQREAARIVAAAEHEALNHRAGAAAEAAQRLAQGRRRADSERQEAASESVARAVAESASILASGEAEADRIDSVVPDRLEADVDEVIRRILDSQEPTR